MQATRLARIVVHSAHGQLFRVVTMFRRTHSQDVRRAMMLLGVITAATVIATTVPVAPAAAAEIPPSVHGEVVYVPFPIDINVDGDLSEWESLEKIFVDYGPDPSKRPGENSSFTFSVAANETHIFITMQMPDQNIITGKHGAEWWNEDSMEFYFNFSDDINSPSYVAGVHQIQMPPYSIGNTDPSDVFYKGSFADAVEPQAIVFPTDDGWGFEASIVVPEGFDVSHGVAFGFQTQANGAALKDRDVKLIWSLLDTDDDSWQNPSVFGTGVFFELGSTDVPEPPQRSTGELTYDVPEPGIGVNQFAYAPGQPMVANFVDDSADPLPWTLTDKDGTVVATGTTEIWGTDRFAGGVVHRIDFSSSGAKGGSNLLEANGLVSKPFSIAGDTYGQLASDALAYYYRNRSGIELLAEHAGADWSRPAGHLSDADIGCFIGYDDAGREWPGCDYRLDGSRGWYDAGDYGKYVVNGGISVWTLMNLYEQFPSEHGDGTMNIPESDNGIPDILDEARWEMDFLLGMQVPEGQPMAGMAHHKLHDRQWGPVPSLPVTEEVNDPSGPAEGAGRYVYPPSTAATLNLAAAAAQCARVFATYDAEYASRCATAASRAWDAADEYRTEFSGSVPGSGGGAYHDGGTLDEWYWAAAELYATTGDSIYRDVMTDSHFHNLVIDEGGSMTWATTSLLGTITTAVVEPDDELATEARASIVENADRLVSLAADQGFNVALDDYVWGSNGDLLNNAIVLALASGYASDPIYQDTAVAALDYVFGANSVGMTYVTGYGTIAPEHPHHRFWANFDEWPASPPGVLVGGPNATADDPPVNTLGILNLPAARRYIDDIESYSTNEVTINWNAPLAWVATWMSAAGIDDAVAVDATASETTVPSDDTTTTQAESASDTSIDSDDSSASTWWLIGALFAIAVIAGGGFVLIRKSRSDST